ncbi:MAG: serine/threonine-protein kinase, partial [Polyangiaceae bacterium]
MHQSDPKSGELSFELLAEIAVGQTARVELCRVVEGPLERELVAVKRLHPHIAEDPQFVDMFRDEVWMTAALKHQHVVEVVGWGQDTVGPWLAVEFVRGVSLQRLMKTVFETGERFTERMVVYLARCICDGLASAHDLRSTTGDRLNLVHRDLTPGNILLGFDGQVKITDFGLAKAKQRLTKTLTGLLKGQPQYMSPEQVQGGVLDGRSDIFALGVVLFELFGGRRPWNAATDLDAMRAITDEPPGDLFGLRPRIDKALVDVVIRCLEKDRDARWQTAVELRERFDEWLNAHGYRSDNHVSLARFVRRNAMRQMRWFERAVAGEFAEDARANQAMPIGRASSLPSEPVHAAPPSGASSARTAEHTRTRDERPASAKGTKLPVPRARSEAKTRLTEDDDGEPRSI